MNRFLRDGKRDKNEEILDTTTNGKTEGNADEGPPGCDMREEVQAPNVPIKEFNLEDFAKANAEEKKQQDGGEVENGAAGEKSQTKVIKTQKKCSDDTPNNSSKCKIFTG